MADHAAFCIDSPRPGEVSSADRINGWLLCSRKLSSIELADARQGSADYGAPRPDVAQAWDLYPNASGPGFRIDVPAGSLEGAEDLRLELITEDGERLKMRLPLQSNDTQHAVLHQDQPFPGYSEETLEAQLRASLADRPGLTLRLDIINKCNLRCVMCRYSDPEVAMRKAKKIAPDDFRTMFEDIAPYTRNVMLSCADEPLMSNHFSDILSYLADDHPHLYIAFCTNAMMMNARIRELLVAKGVSHLYLSLDGVTKKTLESIRVGAKYERIVANFKALRDLKRASQSLRPTVTLNFVMLDSNIHEAPAFVELAARLGAELIDFRQAIPNEYLTDANQYLVNHRAKFNHFRRRILEEAERFSIELNLPPAFNTSERFDPASLPEATLEEFDAVLPDPAGKTPRAKAVPPPASWQGSAADVFNGTFCNRPFSEVLIEDQDKIKPCPWYREPLGKLSEGQTLSEVFFGPEFQALRRKMLHPEGAHGCRQCPIKAEQVMSEVAAFGSGAREELEPA